ncbi:MAG: hypothetical protein MRY64_13280 [Hyphomonadaceae bacterium]|nr:hypothetical protein [Hyphomonadaceae bacterium]
MLKLFFAALCLAALAPAALADEILAREWGAEAGHLYEETAEVLNGAALPARYEDELVRFAVTADRLGNWIDATDRPHDLGCIFRGMADEAEVQLHMLHLPGARQRALRRLATLFHDAESLALAAAYSDGQSHIASEDEPASCPVNPEAVHQYLTEQP